tara:strand:- start:399 stop:2633 length:2235 start_codon:yes stop_codon:yes gene_type:complete
MGAERVGILDLELYVPCAYLELEDLERADDCVGKYTQGLGMAQMAVCDAREDAVSLALAAGRALLTRTGTDPARVGRIDLGTESLVDGAKSGKTVLMDLLGHTHAEGATHLNACYGGTAALFAAVAWVQSEAWDGRLALVVAADVAHYARGPARATGGAGAVAMLVGPDAALVLEPARATTSRNVHDFYKPDFHFPRVDAALSQACYAEAFEACVEHMRARDSSFSLDDFQALACHAPYPKLVRKTLGAAHAPKAEAALRLPARCGNLYTASLYAGVLSARATLRPGQRLLCFSYGSGYVASLFVLRRAAEERQDAAPPQNIEALLGARTRVDVAAMHVAFEGGRLAHPLAPGAFPVCVDAEGRRAYGAGDGSASAADAREDIAARRAALACDDALPWRHVDYAPVIGRCAENVVGYVPLPVGVAGPVTVNGAPRRVPMATTEGCLIASTNRGCKALTLAGGVDARVFRQRMTRAPVFRCGSLAQAAAVREWVEAPDGRARMAALVEGTSRHARLAGATCTLAGSLLYLRVACTCGDAMGMNMVSKACEAIAGDVVTRFDGVQCVSVSGNMCCDKKAAAVNWVDGRGCETVVEARLPAAVVERVLKTTPKALVEVHVCKNLVGSALAGALGGFNAQAANVVAAVFLACGQDAAHAGTSAACLTHLRLEEDGMLAASCTFPGIEVGTVGGGTHLHAQRACLALAGASTPAQLAEVVGAGVLAAELSLLAALASHTLVKAHLAMNR